MHALWSKGTTYANAKHSRIPDLRSPPDYYNLTIQAATANSFTLRATPVSTASQADDGILEINSLGQRFWDNNNDGDTVDAGENDWRS